MRRWTQAVSLTAPGVEQSAADEAVALARDANDYVEDAVRRHPNRFAGFAALPTPDPGTAAKELERCIGAGFQGAMINGHIRGRYLDDHFFWPIFESAVLSSGAWAGSAVNWSGPRSRPGKRKASGSFSFQ
ncbi:MAG TPA: amidohydrolase family protein [Methylocella sp.]|nr:amidohydrolase family protein [Methylocella sp.]